MNIFEQASRLAIRFDSPKGMLTTEDLWKLPLQASNKDKANLDDIAIVLGNQTKQMANAVSYVAPVTNVANEELQLKFDVVKHIIDVKVAERDEATRSAERSQKKQLLMAVLDRKESQELESKTPEEIRAMITAL